MIARMEGNSSGRDLVCGELHELRECQGSAVYTSRPFSAAIYRRRGTVLKYLGQTDLSNDNLDEYGTHSFFGDVLLTSIAGRSYEEENPRYHVLRNNCHIFAKALLERVCPEAEFEYISIAEMFLN